jgi:hypothetical protein
MKTTGPIAMSVALLLGLALLNHFAEHERKNSSP